MLPLFAATLVLSAFLMFSLQPLFAKLVLPLFGGSAAVWNTAMVFFQATLLIGLGAVFEASLIAGATTLATRALGKKIAGETREPDEVSSPPEAESASRI